MRKIKLLACSVMLPLALASCVSPQRANPPPPPAWLMLPGQDLLTPLHEIISPSEKESQPLISK